MEKPDLTDLIFYAYMVKGHIWSVPHGRKKTELGHLNHAV